MRTLTSALLVLSSLLPATSAAAQAPRAAVLVEWDGEDADTLSQTLHANLTARGFDVVATDAVDAARAFSGSTDPLDDVTAAGLRQRLNVPVLVWVSARTEDDRALLALRLITNRGLVVTFGGAAVAEVPARAVALTDEAFAAGATVEPPGARGGGVPAPGPSDPPAIYGAPQVPPGTGYPPAGGGYVSPGAQPGTAQPAPLTPGAARPGGVIAAAPPGVVSSGSAQPGVAQPSAGFAPSNVGRAPPRGVAGQPPLAPREASSANAVATAEPDAAPVAEVNRTQRIRVAVVGLAGIEAYGYGVGARLEIPLVSALQGIDDSLSVGLDLGFAYANLGLDAQGHGVEAFQMPGAAYLTWRFGIDDVEIGPRIGAVLALRIGEVYGPRVRGSRVSLEGMALVGATIGVYVADGVQLFGGLDLAFGPRVSGILSAGVAF